MPQWQWWEQRKISAQEYRDQLKMSEAIRAARVNFESGRLSAKQYKDTIKNLSTFTHEATVGSHNMARSLNAANVSFTGIGEAVANAVLKVGLWIAATTVVLQTAQKIGEVVQLWRDLEVTLERIGVTTSTFGEDLFRYLDATADVAIRMGQPIEQTLQGMDLALRATASYGDAVQRNAVATTMLRDAAILGNVAGMQFNQAIDILVGSLRQTGMELDQGVVLLDKWVAVAKNAAVSVNDLSQGFAIMSSAAASAGLSVDQVNGIITALSESVTLGPVEVGNAIRALMSTLYNEGSIDTMSRYGIAVRDATGEFRSFWSVMNELSALVRSDALTEEQILEIAKAAGAGQRRYAQFVALLKNWDSAVRASNVSANAQGEALEANERIVNTLTNAWDQFTASQNKFWYAFGDRSGLIDSMTGSMKAFTSVFTWMADLNEGFAKTIKLVSLLVIELTALKIVMATLGRFGVTKAINLGFTNVVQGVSRLRAFAGFGGGAMLGLLPTATKQYRAPAGGTTIGGDFFKGGQFLPVSAVTRGQIAETAWVNMGKAMIKPMRSFFSVTAGAMIAAGINREMYDSNWAALGGAIGGGVGAFLGGPAGLAIGGLLGGFIADKIEDATKSSAELAEEERQKWLTTLPPAIAQALEKARREYTLKGYELPIIPKTAEQASSADPGIQRLQAEIADLEEQSRVLRESADEALRHPSIPSGTDFGGPSDFSFYIKQLDDVNTQLDRAREKLRELVQLPDEDFEALTIQDQIAQAAKAIRDELGLQEASQAKVNELKERSLEISQAEFDAMVSLASSVPVTYSTIMAQLERYTSDTGLSETFKALFPDFGSFFELDPRSYQDLVQALGTLVQAESDIADAREKMSATDFLVDVEVNEDSITEAYEYFKELQNNVSKGIGSSINSMIQIASERWNIIDDDEAARAELDRIVDILYEGMLSAQSIDIFESSKETAQKLLPEAIRNINQWIEPGRLEFLAPDFSITQINELLTKYTDMFGKFLGEAEKEVYHAFVRDEGVTTGFLATFETYPEVWAAMNSHLSSIEDNTEKMLEAEYNLPGWYQAPNRYWALKTLGDEYGGFGPAQKGLWEKWEQFVSTLASELKVQQPVIVQEEPIPVIEDKVAEEVKKQYPTVTDFVQTPWGLLPAEQFAASSVVETGSSKDVSNVNALITSTASVQKESRDYLSSINLGIIGLRDEIRQLRADLGSNSATDSLGVSDLERMAVVIGTGNTFIG